MSIQSFRVSTIFCLLHLKLFSLNVLSNFLISESSLKKYLLNKVFHFRINQVVHLQISFYNNIGDNFKRILHNTGKCYLVYILYPFFSNFRNQWIIIFIIHYMTRCSLMFHNVCIEFPNSSVMQIWNILPTPC